MLLKQNHNGIYIVGKKFYDNKKGWDKVKLLFTDLLVIWADRNSTRLVILRPLTYNNNKKPYISKK